MDGDEEKPTDEWRTSTTHFLTRGQTSMVSLNRVGMGGWGGRLYEVSTDIVFIIIDNNCS